MKRFFDLGSGIAGAGAAVASAAASVCSGRSIEGAPICRADARRKVRVVLWVAAALWVGAVLVQFLVNLTWLEGVS